MKLGNRILGLAAAVTLLLISAAPALAAPVEPVELEVQNRTGAAVQLTLKGPTDTSLTVEARNFYFGALVEVIPGAYVYEYEACGRLVREILVVPETGAILVLKKCFTLSHISINNLTGSAFTLSLFGAQNYSFTVPAEGLDFSVIYGGYAFTSNACGLYEVGRLRASAALGQPLIWEWGCGATSELSVSLTATIE